MYNEEIKALLKKHYGRSTYSLTIGASPRTGNRIYYYTLDNENEILAVRDILNSRLSKSEIDNLSELRQMNSIAFAAKNQCACYSEEKDGSWRLSFYNVDGIRYHRSFGKRIAATLMLSIRPVVDLSEKERDTFYGFWNRPFCRKDADQQRTEGISYWINKNLYKNLRFRAFVADFFSMIGAMEGKYILKDVGRTIERFGCFIPSISLSRLLSFHTPAALIREFLPEQADLHMNLNKTDINIGYVMAKLMPFISIRDWKVLTGMEPELATRLITLRSLFDGMGSVKSAKEFISNYYQRSVGNRNLNCAVKNYALDYVDMCFQLNVPIRLSYSLNGLIQAHDTMGNIIMRKANEKELSLPLITIPSRFDALEKGLEVQLPNEFERIRTTERLLREGENQHNCVFSRRNIIRSDEVAVFHWDYNGQSCTIQFSMDNKGRYYVDEIKAKYNEICYASTLIELNRILLNVQELVDHTFEREECLDCETLF